MQWLAEKCLVRKLCNIAFNAFFLLRDVDKCVETLIVSKRYSEAAFFSKAYCPSHIRRIVELWKGGLQKTYPLTGNFFFCNKFSYEIGGPNGVRGGL